MTEWGVVGVIIALVGLVAGIVGPITKLTQSITKLTVVVDRLDAEQAKQRCEANTTHKELWDYAHAHDVTLQDHETRIRVMEGTKN